MLWRARRCRRSESRTRRWPDVRSHRSRAKACARRFAVLFWSCPSLRLCRGHSSPRYDLNFPRVAGRWDPTGGDKDSPECRVLRAELMPTGTQDSGLRTQHLLPDSELIDDRAVALLVGLLQVVQKTTAAADELQQAATAVMILRVRFEVFGQVADAVREKCDLHFGRAGITVVGAILRNHFGFLLLGAWQNTVSLASYVK